VSDCSARDILGDSGKGADGSKIAIARDIIAELLATGPKLSDEVWKACKAAGVSFRTYMRARKDLKVESGRTGFGANGEWMIAMPPDAAKDAK
jgi:hypothetical protein